MLQNQFVQGLLVFLLVVGAYAAYVNLNYVETETGEVIPATEVVDTSDKDTIDESESTNTDDNSDSEALDLAGTHIMPDGSVMTGKGVTLPDASVLADGMIELADGTVLEPAFDLRPKDTEVETEIPTSMEEVNEVSFDIVGDNFTYDVTEIRVKKGDVVTINFLSEEGFHDWVVDEFDAATERVDEGGHTSVTFVADKVGTFEYYCTIKGHREKGQVGTLIVE